MTYGLRVWDSTGGLMLDVTDRITRFISVYSFYMSPGQARVDISVPGASPGTWFAVSPRFKAIVMNDIVRVIRFGTSTSVSGTVLVFRA